MKPEPKTEPLRDGKRRNLYLDEETILHAREIGEGSVSKGVRLAVEAYNFFNSAKPEAKTVVTSQYNIKEIKNGW